MNLQAFLDAIDASEPVAPSPGTIFTDSDLYKSSRGIRKPIDVGLPPNCSLRATLTATGQSLTSYTRPTGVIELGTQRLTVRDLLAQGTTDAATVRYTREVSLPSVEGDGTLAVAEDDQKNEVAWDVEEKDAHVRKIAVIGRVSQEAYDDQAFLRSYIDNRLRYLVQAEEERQLLSGSGGSPSLDGILGTTGVQTQTGATGDTADNIFAAITKVRSIGQFEPDGIVLSPTQYQNLRLARDENSQYFGGGYFLNPYGNGPFQMQPPIWGLPTVITTSIDDDVILVGAFKLGAQIFDRMGLRVDTTTTDADDWSNNRIAVRVEERLALAVYRPKAFCKVTDVPTGGS